MRRETNENNKSNEILVVSDNLSKKNLKDDLEFFIRDKAILLDASINLINQNLDNLLLCSYADISAMSSKYIILLDIEYSSLNEIEHAINLAQDTAYVIYEQESENIKTLKEKNV